MPTVSDPVDLSDTISCTLTTAVASCIVITSTPWWKLTIHETCAVGTYPITFSCSDDNTEADPVNLIRTVTQTTNIVISVNGFNTPPVFASTLDANYPYHFYNLGLT